jgi:hypothetical protein
MKAFLRKIEVMPVRTQFCVGCGKPAEKCRPLHQIGSGLDSDGFCSDCKQELLSFGLYVYRSKMSFGFHKRRR